jgi:hypothetical protein
MTSAKPYSFEEDTAMLFLRTQGWTYAGIGAKLGRSASGIRQRLGGLLEAERGDVRKLRAEVALLRIENARLREQLEAIGTAATESFPPEWGLSKSEGKMLRVILARQLATFEAIAGVLYDDSPKEEPGLATLKVFAMRIRRKLAEAGVEVRVEGKWGEGFYIREEGKAKLRAALRAGSGSGKANTVRNGGGPTVGGRNDTGEKTGPS